MDQIVSAVREGKISFDHPQIRISEEAQKFITKLLHPEFAKRVPASVALQEDWLLKARLNKYILEK